MNNEALCDCDAPEAGTGLCVYLAISRGRVQDVASLFDVGLKHGRPGFLPAAVVANQQLATGF